MTWKLAAIHALGILTGLGLLWLWGWTWFGSARELGPGTKLASLSMLVAFLILWGRAWRTR